MTGNVVPVAFLSIMTESQREDAQLAAIVQRAGGGIWQEECHVEGVLSALNTEKGE